MSEVLERKILEDVRESNHFPLLFDETTDCTVTEQPAVHGCYISNDGQLKCCYLKIIDLLQPNSSAQSGLQTGSCISANAQTIIDRVGEFIIEAKLEKI